MEGFFFKSSLFSIVEGEDEETNPYRYGKQLSTWLSEKLTVLGYETEIIPEDWGWCIICKRKPFLLWIGCGNMDESDEETNKTVQKENIVWHCFVEAEISFFKKFFSKVNTIEAMEKLNNELKDILEKEKSINLAETSQ